MTPEARFWSEPPQGWTRGILRTHSGGFMAWHNKDGAEIIGEGPTRDEACAALLAKLEPAALPRLAPTLRGEVRVLLDWVRSHRADWEDALGDLTAATPAQREAWLEAFQDEPATCKHPANTDLLGEGWEACYLPPGHDGEHRFPMAPTRAQYNALHLRLVAAERERDAARLAPAAGEPETLRVMLDRLTEPGAGDGFDVGLFEYRDGKVQHASGRGLAIHAWRRAGCPRAGAGWVRDMDGSAYRPGDVILKPGPEHRAFCGGYRFDLPPLPKDEK